MIFQVHHKDLRWGSQISDFHYGESESGWGWTSIFNKIALQGNAKLTIMSLEHIIIDYNLNN